MSFRETQQYPSTVEGATAQKGNVFQRFGTWVKEHPGYFLLMLLNLVVVGLVIYIATCSCKKNVCAIGSSVVKGDERSPNGDRGSDQYGNGDNGVTGVYISPLSPDYPSSTGAGQPGSAVVCPPMASQFAPHSQTVPPTQRATQGANQPHQDNTPIEQQARAIHRSLYNHPDLPCFEPRDPCYDPAQSLLTESPGLVPSYQQRLKDLPAMRHLNLQQENPATGFGPNTRQGIDTLASETLGRQERDEGESLGARVTQTAGAPDGLAGIYGRGDTKGISMINQKSRMTDPTKMLPRADPAQEQHRMVQAGPSIADIGCRVPKAADIMRMMRGGSSVLSNTIPRDKPPVYTEGLNAFRPTRLPAQTNNGSQLFGIQPLEISDVIDYRPNPFLYGSRGYGAPVQYAV